MVNWQVLNELSSETEEWNPLSEYFALPPPNELVACEKILLLDPVIASPFASLLAIGSSSIRLIFRFGLSFLRLNEAEPISKGLREMIRELDGDS